MFEVRLARGEKTHEDKNQKGQKEMKTEGAPGIEKPGGLANRRIHHQTPPVNEHKCLSPQ